MPFSREVVHVKEGYDVRHGTDGARHHSGDPPTHLRPAAAPAAGAVTRGVDQRVRYGREGTPLDARRGRRGVKPWTLRRTAPGSSMPWEVAYRGTWMGFFSTQRRVLLRLSAGQAATRVLYQEEWPTAGLSDERL